jgi:ABC-type lipoprotein export system ATPase subunit
VSEPVVRCRGVARTYGEGDAATIALRAADCDVAPGALIAITGPSGSGKSTLLHIMAGLDEPTAGTVDWPGIGAGVLRPGPVAMIFQGPSLLPPLTVVENVALPLVLSGVRDDEAHERGLEALRALDLADLADKLPEEISGGQAQRVAAARALSGTPRLILADEPTGQLDRASGAAVVDLLLAAAQRSGAALVLSTHDRAVADRLPERWTMADGRLTAGRGEAAWSR